MYLSAVKPYLRFNSCSTLYPCISPSLKSNHIRNNVRLSVSSKKSDLKPEHSHNGPHSKPKEIPQHQRSGASQNQVKEESDSKVFPSTIPKKPRRGRRSEAAAVEDFMRDSLERTFASIREQNSEVMMDKEQIMKEKIDDSVESDDAYEGNEESVKSKKMVVEEDNPDWPLDADVGWGIRASDYFEKHAIKNVVGEDGVEIDWEGEIDDNWVKEINCLEWETFAFHPSPLIVLVFERYNRFTIFVMSSALSLWSILDAHKLTGPNFADWLRNLRIVLMVEKLEYVLDSPKSTEPASDAHNDEHIVYRKWIDDANVAQCIMLASINIELHKQHEHMDAHTILMHLQELYDVAGRTARYEISKELFGCRMSEGSSVNDHVLKMINLIERLGQLGFAMDGEVSLDLVLQSLPSSFSQFVVNFHMNKLDVSLPELHNMLKTAESNFPPKKSYVLPIGEGSNPDRGG
ncbi:uncharacterized protein LOC141707638 isoform X1 [Apium graveolens]|uniref:uncharacterized protein LOC141707638 isoform X1 n=1 Tax=Apium graveolens TaxID=4045 RepID=UPI003D79B7AE